MNILKQIEEIANKVDIKKIRNQHLKKSIEERVNCLQFNFSRSHHDHTDSRYSHQDYSYKEKGYGKDHTDRTRPTTQMRIGAGHEDSRSYPIIHVDKSKKTYSEHTDR